MVWACMKVYRTYRRGTLEDEWGSNCPFMVILQHGGVLEEIARACPDTRIRPSFTLVLTGPSGRIGGFLGVTAFY